MAAFFKAPTKGRVETDTDADFTVLNADPATDGEREVHGDGREGDL
jgi:imidazolonepropionase-like amidohydrolase